ncbi:MAG TPA: hypothetical protein VL371_08175 [Gemmataceae bacterium]|jgi:hypothetical protein|nr:hypothetical protein [Gemmataceae bacterium]
MASSEFGKRGRKSAARRSRVKVCGFRPRLDVLEDRTVPSFFTSPSFAVGSVPVGAAVGDFNGGTATVSPTW